MKNKLQVNERGPNLPHETFYTSKQDEKENDKETTPYIKRKRDIEQGETVTTIETTEDGKQNAICACINCKV
jgi:hypothetical protein